MCVVGANDSFCIKEETVFVSEASAAALALVPAWAKASPPV